MGCERIRKNSEIVEGLAKTFPVNSPEYQALKNSALAFSYVILKHEQEFDEYVRNLWKPLTAEESEALDRLMSDEGGK